MRVLAIAATWAAALTAPCPGAVAHIPGTTAATQLVTVAATSAGATTASLELWQRHGGCWRHVAGPWRAWLGRSGISTHKREGDGATPAGTYLLGSTFYGVAANPGVHGAYHRLVCGDWWDEDARSPAYNTFQDVACGATPAGTFHLGSTFYGVAANPGVHGSYHRLVCGDWWDEDARSPAYNTFQHVACGATPPFGGGSEALWRIVPQYRSFAVVEYNAGPIVRGRGSAIFLHVSAGRPTAGCVSLPEAELVQVLRWLRPAAHPIIHLG